MKLKNDNYYAALKMTLGNTWRFSDRIKNGRSLKVALCNMPAVDLVKLVNLADKVVSTPQGATRFYFYEVK